MGETFALALAIAASPFPVVPAILLLFTARPRPTSLAFLGGWFGGIGLVAAVFALLADGISTGGDSPTWLSGVRIVVGAALVAYGVRQWITRGAAGELPGWLRSIDSATPRTALRVALLLSVANPKVVLLAAAAGIDIGAAGRPVAAELALVVVFTAVASISVAVPVLAHAIFGARVLPPLQAAKDWLLRNNAAVMAVVLAVIGLVLITNGVSGL
ncbi:GAP family protein [Pengzhenrongella sicca]|uniref:GAP family protein n=1 Tax=Pengzhenrongella sicca TaxID=2819238 RepID=A0A8A4ZEJ2_9MICO|nr:GAP family protein [Pengzhenrongella sicca]QTE28966.1 GAP family protein [Pengzhenrongella sicca]